MIQRSKEQNARIVIRIDPYFFGRVCLHAFTNEILVYADDPCSRTSAPCTTHYTL